MKQFILITTAISISIFMGWMDTSPHWDDTGITVVAVLVTSFAYGFITPKFAWMYALIIGAGIVLFNAILCHNFGAMMAMIFAFAGAYMGVFMKRIIFAK